MLTFLEYLKEYNRQLREDVVMAAGDAVASGGDSITPSGEANGVQNLDVASPKAMNAMTDNSVLGNYSDDKRERDGFLGKNDFHVPYNVLSGSTEIPQEVKPKVLKRI